MTITRRLVLVVLAAAVVGAARATAQVPPAIGLPPEPYIAFAINEVTGAPMRLEVSWTKAERSGRSYYCYLEGAASPVVLAANEPHRFIITVGGLKTRPDVDKWRSIIKLERLHGGEKGRRYATEEFVPTDMTPYGEVTTTLDKKNKPLYWIALIYTPREPLPPGEYALSAMGLREPGGFAPRNGQAFRIAP